MNEPATYGMYYTQDEDNEREYLEDTASFELVVDNQKFQGYSEDEVPVKHAFVAQMNDGKKGDHVGRVTFRLDRGALRILDIAVAEDWKNRGVVEFILEGLVRTLQHNSRDRVIMNIREKDTYVQVFLRDPKASTGDEMAFRAVDTIDDFYDDPPDNAYVMQHRLPIRETTKQYVDELERITGVNWAVTAAGQEVEPTTDEEDIIFKTTKPISNPSGAIGALVDATDVEVPGFQEKVSGGKAVAVALKFEQLHGRLFHHNLKDKALAGQFTISAAVDPRILREQGGMDSNAL